MVHLEEPCASELWWENPICHLELCGLGQPQSLSASVKWVFCCLLCLLRAQMGSRGRQLGDGLFLRTPSAPNFWALLLQGSPFSGEERKYKN